MYFKSCFIFYSNITINLLVRKRKIFKMSSVRNWLGRDSLVPSTAQPSPLTSLTQVADYVKLVSADLAQTEQIVANLDQEASSNFTTLADRLTALSDSADTLTKAFSSFSASASASFSNISTDIQALQNREIIQWCWKSATRNFGTKEFISVPDTLIYASPTCKIYTQGNFFVVPQQDPPKLYRCTFTGNVIGSNGGTFIGWYDSNLNSLNSVSFNAQAGGVIASAATITNECLVPSGSTIGIRIVNLTGFIPADHGMVTIQQV